MARMASTVIADREEDPDPQPQPGQPAEAALERIGAHQDERQREGERPGGPGCQ